MFFFPLDKTDLIDDGKGSFQNTCIFFFIKFPQNVFFSLKYLFHLTDNIFHVKHYMLVLFKHLKQLGQNIKTFCHSLLKFQVDIEVNLHTFILQINSE